MVYSMVPIPSKPTNGKGGGEGVGCRGGGGGGEGGGDGPRRPQGINSPHGPRQFKAVYHLGPGGYRPGLHKI